MGPWSAENGETFGFKIYVRPHERANLINHWVSNSAVQICVPAISGPAFAALCLLVGWNLMNRVSFEALLPRLEMCLCGLSRQSDLDPC